MGGRHPELANEAAWPRLDGRLVSGGNVCYTLHRCHHVSDMLGFRIFDSEGRTVRSPQPVGYVLTRSPDNADISMAAMTSWRRTASAKSGTV